MNPLLLVGAAAVAYFAFFNKAAAATRVAWDSLTPEQQQALDGLARTGTPEQLYNISDPVIKQIVVGRATALYKRQEVTDYINGQDFIKMASPALILSQPEDKKVKLVEVALKAGRVDLAAEMWKRGAGYVASWIPFLSKEATGALYAGHVQDLQAAVSEQERKASMTQKQLLQEGAVNVENITFLKGYRGR